MSVWWNCPVHASDDVGRIERLRSIPLFAGLPDDALERVLEHSTEFECKPGHTLVQPNHPGAGLFVIEEGTVDVELPNRKIELGPGEFFGELALLAEDAVHVARVRAATEVRCLAVARDDFDGLLESEPSIAVSMLKVLARRLAADAASH
jgi:CRP-like cAMP-binding protein